jgi:hypothetical protein
VAFSVSSISDSSYIRPQYAAADATKVAKNTPEVKGQDSGNVFFHVMKDLASKEPLIFTTYNGNIGGLVNFNVGDGNEASIESISKALTQQQFCQVNSSDSTSRMNPYKDPNTPAVNTFKVTV